MEFIEPQVRCSVKLFPAFKINSKDSANMKNKNLIFSPKKLQTSPGSSQIMTNTTIKYGKLFLFQLLSDLWQFETFLAFPYKLLNVADVIIMHSVPMSLLCILISFISEMLCKCINV